MPTSDPARGGDRTRLVVPGRSSTFPPGPRVRRSSPTASTRETAVTTTINPADLRCPARGTEPESGASLEKVRDLLFGVQMRDYEQKFARLEERIAKETSDFRDEVRKRLSAIEAIIQREVDSLSDRLKAEQDNRANATADLRARARRNGADLRAKDHPARRSDGARSLREMRQQLHEQEQRLHRRSCGLQADEIITRLTANRRSCAATRRTAPGSPPCFTGNGDASERSVQIAGVGGPVGCLKPPSRVRATARRRPRPSRRQISPSCER